MTTADRAFLAELKELLQRYDASILKWQPGWDDTDDYDPCFLIRIKGRNIVTIGTCEINSEKLGEMV